MQEILAHPGRVLVLGRPDTGKTSFVQLLAAQALKQGYKVGVVDLDPGQSWIGPPATIGFWIPTHPGFDPSSPSPKSLWFIGAASPAHRSSQILTGIGKFLRSAGPLDLVLFDSSGYLGPLDARRLIVQVIGSVRPRHLVKLGKVEALDLGAELHSLEPLPGVQRRSTAQRRRLRNASWQSYFKGAIRRSLPDKLIAETIYPSQLLGLSNPEGELSGLGICTKPAPGLEVLTPVRGRITGLKPGSMGIDPESHCELNPTEFGLLRVIHDQMRLHPEMELEDLYKLCAQVVEGGVHYNAQGGGWASLHRAMIASSSIKGSPLSLSRLWGMIERLARSRLIPFDVRELNAFKPGFGQEPLHSPG